MVAEKEGKVKESIIVMVRGTDKINLEAVKAAVGAKKIRIPNQNQALTIYSYQRGGTPPIGFSSITTVVMDKKLLNPSRLPFGGGGDAEHLIVIESEELLKRHKENEEIRLLIEAIGEK
jgi:prolyl-tRNA editing enzyme YbaK/EbsC (Cys-tRNA(Pro) deacylase)